ncbi:hypothetical protein FO519_008469 [Halicephalobus sp. NKZ332]|nr:hypothetical protein FO519_008469 [Halicephalobus sp. NKZ332]
MDDGFSHGFRRFLSGFDQDFFNNNGIFGFLKKDPLFSCKALGNLSKASSVSSIVSIDSYAAGYWDSGFESTSEKSLTTPVVSRRVFLGGLPKDCALHNIHSNLRGYNFTHVDWPSRKSNNRMMGYCFVEFVDEQEVLKFVEGASEIGGRWFKSMRFSRRKEMEIEIRPFFLTNAEWEADDGYPEDSFNSTIFLGGVPRDATAKQLADALSVYGPVFQVSIQLETRTHYPKGVAIAVFKKKECFKRAMSAKLLLFGAPGFRRRIEMKPFIDKSGVCPMCLEFSSMVFCGHIDCLNYSCNECYRIYHEITQNDHSNDCIGRGTFYTSFSDRSRRF